MNRPFFRSFQRGRQVPDAMTTTWRLPKRKWETGAFIAAAALWLRMNVIVFVVNTVTVLARIKRKRHPCNRARMPLFLTTHVRVKLLQSCPKSWHDRLIHKLPYPVLSGAEIGRCSATFNDMFLGNPVRYSARSPKIYPLLTRRGTLLPLKMKLPYWDGIEPWRGWNDALASMHPRIMASLTIMRVIIDGKLG